MGRVITETPECDVISGKARPHVNKTENLQMGINSHIHSIRLNNCSFISFDAFKDFFSFCGLEVNPKI